MYGLSENAWNAFNHILESFNGKEIEEKEMLATHSLLWGKIPVVPTK